MNKNLKRIFVVAWTEYGRWITNPRMLMVAVMLVFVRTLAAVPLLEHAVKYGMPLNIIEPFIAVGNSNVLVLLMPCVFMVLMSDYPQITGNTLITIPRIGKKNWHAGQRLFRWMAVISFLAMMLLGGILVSKGQFQNDWSEVVLKYNFQFPGEEQSFASQLLPSNLYNQMSITAALLHTVLLLGLYLVLLSEVMCLFQLMQLQPYGLIAAIVVMAIGVVTCSLKLQCMWLFPLANAMIGLHYDEILSVLKIPVWYSYVYFLVLNAVCAGMNRYFAAKLQFMNVERVS